MMNRSKPTKDVAAELHDMAEQLKVELSILMFIEQSLRCAIQWNPQDRRSNHKKLSTLRFVARSFERHLTRTRMLADRGGYMHAVTDANPHLVRELKALKRRRDGLQQRFDRILLRLEDMLPDDTAAFVNTCVELERYLDQLKIHGQHEMELLQHAILQEQGGEG